VSERQTPAEEQAVTYLRRVLVELNETRRRLHEAESRLAEPIAIVGMGCRYPGGVRSPEELWELLAAGGDAVSGLPEDRGWELDTLPNPDPGDPSVTFKGGFIAAGEFDAEFFGVGEDEARVIDPQQRLLLETSWEACEYAGIDPETLRGSDTGVFIGIGEQGYVLWLVGAALANATDHLLTGNSASMISGRLAHVLRLEGPAVTIDTACSSSSVALHLACQSLRQGDCSMALAGGSSVIGGPWLYLGFDKRSAGLSLDGRCKSFADGADGMGLSEGVGVVLLERLADARRLGHEVLAVVRGSAFNQDGLSNGLAAPNGLALERVVRHALDNAGLLAGQVDAVDAHGTGTPLGDPIEAHALIACYGQGRAAGRPLWLGSMKSNMGHIQAAGGVGAAIKIVMAMRHGVLPKTLHVGAPSRHVDWSSGHVSLLREPVPWVREGEPRRAAVNSYGMSGTNVHIILEEPPAPEPQRGAPSDDTSEPVLWPLSGRGEEGLRRQARRLAQFLAERPELDIADVSRSLAVRRPGLSHRAFVIGADRERLLAGLESVAEGRWEPSVAGGGEERRDALAALGGRWVAGEKVDWEALFAGSPARLVRLPTYAFERRHHWVEHAPLWAADGPIAQLVGQIGDVTPDAVPPGPAASSTGGEE
jgi:acyl transferase domain-containing protein